VVLLAVMAVAASANLISNLSFELGTGQGGNLSGATITDWNNYSGSGWWADDAGAVYDGTWAIKRWDDDTGIYADFSATPGITYDFSLWCYDNSTEPLVNRHVELKAEWLDGSYGKLGETVIGQFGAGTVNTWTEIAGQSEASAGTVWGRLVITTGADGAGSGGAVYYDLASVTAVPEPTALALLGLGIVTIGLVRHKLRK